MALCYDLMISTPSGSHAFFNNIGLLVTMRLSEKQSLKTPIPILTMGYNFAEFVGFATEFDARMFSSASAHFVVFLFGLKCLVNES